MSTRRWNTLGKICARSRHKRKWVNKKQKENNRKWRRQKIRNHLQCHIVPFYIADFFVSDNIQGDQKVSPQ